MRDQRPGQKNSPRALTSGVGHARSIETLMRRPTSNDRNGAISYWIFTNKISALRKLQDLSNGIFLPLTFFLPRVESFGEILSNSV